MRFNYRCIIAASAVARQGMGAKLRHERIELFVGHFEVDSPIVQDSFVTALLGHVDSGEFAFLHNGKERTSYAMSIPCSWASCECLVDSVERGGSCLRRTGVFSKGSWHSATITLSVLEIVGRGSSPTDPVVGSSLEQNFERSLLLRGNLGCFDLETAFSEPWLSLMRKVLFGLLS